MLNTILRGHYKIINHLGGGGFGQTYLAEDIDLPQHPICVVKQLKPTSQEPIVLEVAKRLFNQEANVLYSLGSHDRIPRLLAHFQEGEEFYLVQEFADGKDLTHEIGKGIRVPETFAIALIREILEILVFVHERGVVHRDIKPANLIRRKADRRIVLIDFGAVKEIGGLAVDSQGNTNLTIAIGSPGYMPTEQINGKPRFSSDIYAVGMIGIQAITGAEPRRFAENPETAELMWRDRLQGNYSPQFLDILDKMVRYDFRQRYQTANEVLEAIATLPSVTNHDLMTIVTSDASNGDASNGDVTAQQVATTQNKNRSKINILKSASSPKLWIIGGLVIAVAAIAMIAISKFRKSDSQNLVANNSPIPTPKVTQDLTPRPSPLLPSSSLAPETSITKSPAEILIREAQQLNSYNVNDPQRALKKIEEALKLEPKNEIAWEIKGRVLMRLRLYKDAQLAFQNALDINPNLPTVIRDRNLVMELMRPAPKK